MRTGWGRAAFCLIFGVATVARAAVMLPGFGPGSPVTELNTAENDAVTWASPDGLSVVKQSYVGASPLLYSATRLASNVAFSPPGTGMFANINALNHETSHGKLSADGLELFYADRDVNLSAPAQIRRATRASTAAPFGAGVVVANVNDAVNHTYPSFLSPDGLRLYLFQPIPSAPFVATRASVGTSFGTPAASPFANLGFVDHPWLTPNELEMYFAVGGKLWWTSRPNLATPFAAAQEIAGLGGPMIALDCPVLWGDTLFYFRNGDIYAAKMVPEPLAVGSMMMLLAATMRVRRPNVDNLKKRPGALN
jgi:hypothetical protein